MIVFLTLCYCAVLALLVKFGLVKWTLWWKLSPLGWMLLLLVVLFIPMQWGAPAGSVNVYQYVVEIIPNVGGEVIDVPIDSLEPLEKGDVLFQIDPEPFQAEVDRLKAASAEAEQKIPQLKAAFDNAAAVQDQVIAERDLAQLNYQRAEAIRKDNVGAIAMLEVDQARQALAAAEAGVRAAEAAKKQARFAYESEIDGQNTTVAQLKAQLVRAEFDFRQTTVRAPSDGHVIAASLRPGQRVAALPLRSWMSFVSAEETRLYVGIPQYTLRNVKPGQQAEITLKLFPGKVLSATVDGVAYVTPAGQVQPSGVVPAAPTRSQPAVPYGVRLKLSEDVKIDVSRLPGGAIGSAAIYTEHTRATHVIRRVMIRMQAWMNYVVPW